jgi:pimeloyl-ACP methyl ester carboxylesterase
MTSKEWKSQGLMIPIFDKKIFTIDAGDSKDCLVILHGYATSSFDYYKVLPELSKHYRVIIHDLIGFGLSDKLENQYFTIMDQVEYTLELWKIMGLEKVTILAHDYGDAIAKEIISRKNAGFINLDIKKLILFNVTVPINFNEFVDIQNILTNDVSKKMSAMMASIAIFKKNIKEMFFDKTKITDEELTEMWYLFECNNGRDTINFISNYISERKIFWFKWNKALEESKLKIHLIWGKQDPLATENIAESLSEVLTNNKVCWIENSGHFPMLETPKEWTDCIIIE